MKKERLTMKGKRFATYLHGRSFISLFIIRCFLFIALFTINCSLLTGLDFHFRPKGFVTIPMGEGNIAADGNERYSMGGGGEIGFEVDLSTAWPNPLGIGYTLGVEGGMQINPQLTDDANNIYFYSGGGVLGLYFFPLSRLLMRVDGGAGVYLSANDEGKSDSALYWRGGGELGFRFTPGFTLAANGGWRQFMPGYDFAESGLINSGYYAGLTAQLTFQAGVRAGREGIGVTFDQYEELYPVFMRLYQTNPAGFVRIRNNENAGIRNVQIFFRAPGYTASEFPCGSFLIIPRGRRVEVPLLADFSPEVLQFTDKGRILGELVIRYTFLGQKRETVKAVSIATHNRNMITQYNPAAFAAFISPTSPETLDFARFIAGLERASRRTGHNQNMQYAIWLLEGLRASNIRLGETYASDNEAQFPAETLSYRTGSGRDLALLFAAALEGVGIPSAFIQTENDFLVAVGLGVNQNAAETLFNGTGRILIVNNEVWLPLSMTGLNNGFMASWSQAVTILNNAFREEKLANFVIVQEAWTSYPPAPLPELGRGVLRTDNGAALREVNRVMQEYISQEITPIINRQAGNTTAAGQNRLGILYARAGRIAEAKAAYERAAGMGSVPAMTNRGNLALIERDFATAERWFRAALAREGGNRVALRGLERVQGSR